MSRDDPLRDNGRDAPEKEFKAFVGGISWHMSDRELKDSKLCSRSQISVLICTFLILLHIPFLLQPSESSTQSMLQLCWTK